MFLGFDGPHFDGDFLLQFVLKSDTKLVLVTPGRGLLGRFGGVFGWVRFGDLNHGSRGSSLLKIRILAAVL